VDPVRGGQAQLQRQGGQDQLACCGRRPSPPSRKNGVTNSTPPAARGTAAGLRSVSWVPRP